MVRLNGTEQPIDRQDEFAGERALRIAAMLCRDPRFWEYLHQDNQIMEPTEREATDWLREFLGIPSRVDLRTNHEARIRLESVYTEFNRWNES
jgi:hypothetical protein